MDKTSNQFLKNIWDRCLTYFLTNEEMIHQRIEAFSRIFLTKRNFIGVGVAGILAVLLSSGFGIYLIKDLTQSQLKSSGSTLSNRTDVLDINQHSLADEERKIIYSRNIFNHEAPLEEEGAKEEGQAPVDTRSVVKSELPLKVVGLIYAGGPYNGLATILNTNDQSIASYIVGEMVGSDAELFAILPDRIILERIPEGNKEYIAFDQKEIVRSRRQKEAKERASRPQPATTFAVGPAGDVFTEEGFERRENEIVMTETYKNRLLTDDFTKVLQDAKATPNIVDGQVKGFKLSRIREPSIYRKAGLEDGDVILEINGQPLTSAAGAIKLLQSMRNDSNFEVQIERDGKTFDMAVDVKG